MMVTHNGGGMKQIEYVFDEILKAWVSPPKPKKKFRVTVSNGVTEFETVKWAHSAVSAARAAENEFAFEPLYVTVKLEG
jgi:hypothetical protein